MQCGLSMRTHKATASCSNPARFTMKTQRLVYGFSYAQNKVSSAINFEKSILENKKLRAWPLVSAKL